MLDILLVEDEPILRLPMTDALRNAGHRVMTAADGGEGLALLRDHFFDVVLTDLRMPKADGHQIFRYVREHDLPTDVILMTAHGDVTEGLAALRDGAVDYLTKPFDVDELLCRLARIDVNRSRRRNPKPTREKLT